MRSRVSKRLIILEGPDGAGKTTIGRQIAEHLDAHFVHLGPFRDVDDGADLARFYVEAMMPAVLGDRDVVMDRCWISESPYGAAFRRGRDRLGWAVRPLERLAWRCRTVVAFCLPPWDTVSANFVKSRGDQMLDRVDQLRAVYDAYTSFDGLTSLPRVIVDPISEPLVAWAEIIDAAGSTPHAGAGTAGNIRGGKVLVVTPDPTADPGPGDVLYEWPFGRLSGPDATRAFTSALDFIGASEAKLYWASASRLTGASRGLELPIVAVGPAARDAVRRNAGRDPDVVLPFPAGTSGVAYVTEAGDAARAFVEALK